MAVRAASAQDRAHFAATAGSQLAQLTGLPLQLMPEEPIQIDRAENAFVLDEQTGAYAGLLWDGDRGVVNLMWLYPDGLPVPSAKELVGAALQEIVRRFPQAATTEIVSGTRKDWPSHDLVLVWQLRMRNFGCLLRDQGSEHGEWYMPVSEMARYCGVTL